MSRILSHLRLYESLQILVPGLFGILNQAALPRADLLLYLIAYAAHTLSVYSYNDYCDFESDSLNLRKSLHASKSKVWLRNQTVLLTALYLAAALLLPLPVSLLFVGTQIICMAYSHPRIRLKGRVLGSELAHFVTGCSYFISGVVVAGGDPRVQWLGGLLFGLLYASGGTFNEVLDHDPDRRAKLRHLVVVVGRRRGLLLVLAGHCVAFVLLALYAPSPAVIGACAAAVLAYAAATPALVRGFDDTTRLLRFRRRYRILFAALLVVAFASRVAGHGRDGTAAPAIEVETGAVTLTS